MGGHHDELEVFRPTLERYHLFYVPGGYGDDYAICELLVDALGSRVSTRSAIRCPAPLDHAVQSTAATIREIRSRRCDWSNRLLV
jgi:hypothetical protein